MLIGLHGKKQAGKDTVHQRMEALLGNGNGAVVERISFADLIYESAAAALDVTPDELREWKNDPDMLVVVGRDCGDPEMFGNSGMTIREFLQRYGTEAHRNVFADNFWVDSVNLRDHDRKIVVVTDVRFRNEAQAVIDAGGAVVHVVGPPEVEEAGDGHASEEVLPERYVDHVLVNALRHDAFASLDSEVSHMFLRLRAEGY